MNHARRPRPLRVCLRRMAFALGLWIGASPAAANVIFLEEFNGASDDLNGSAPDVGAGAENWIATPIFNQDGSLDPDAGSATLAFTPTDGSQAIVYEDTSRLLPIFDRCLSTSK